MIGLAFLAAASASGPPSYPSKAVITEFRAVCDVSDAVMQSDTLEPEADRIADWRKLAEQRGWQVVALADGTTRNAEVRSTRDPERIRDYVVSSRVGFLNAMLNSVYPNGSALVGVTGPIFKKIVAGRTLYLSTYASIDSENGFMECRLHDPLGDGMSRLPVRLSDVEDVAGTKVMQTKGPYGSASFFWPYNGKGINAFDVHIGFKGTGLSSYGPVKGGGNPYAPYGMTFVVQFRDQPDIVVT